jgi:hypothetical protein
LSLGQSLNNHTFSLFWTTFGLVLDHLVYSVSTYSQIPNHVYVYIGISTFYTSKSSARWWQVDVHIGAQVPTAAGVVPRYARLLKVNRDELKCKLCLEVHMHVLALHTEGNAEARQAGLEVELRALHEKGGLTVVVDLEERRAALDLGLHEAWGCHFDEALRGQCLAERGEDLRTDAERRRWSCHGGQGGELQIGLNGGVGFLWRRSAKGHLKWCGWGTPRSIDW